MTKHLTILAVCLAIIVSEGCTIYLIAKENDRLLNIIEKQQTELTMYKALVKQYRKEVTFNKIER